MFRLRLILVTLVLVAVGLPTAAQAGHPGDATGKATLHQQNGSGVRGNVTFADNGNDTNTVSGTAWGLEPNTTMRYVSLIYDTGSVPGGRGKPGLACEPINFDLIEKMFVGFWTTDGAGHGTLVQFFAGEFGNEANPGPFTPSTYVPVGDIGTISIRDGDAGFALVACGKVSVHSAR